MTEPELGALLRAAQRGCGADGRDCPDAATIAALAAGTLESARRDAVLDRVAACAMCADALKLAVDSEAFARELARDVQRVTAPAPPRARPRRALPAFALAASVVVAVGASLLLSRAPAPDALRGSTLAAVEPVDGATLATAPVRLAWACAAPAAMTVDVFDAAGVAVWQGASTACSIDMPADARARIGRGDWLWQVRSASGTPVAGPWRFRIE
jgi:hypothetical protein